MYRKLLIHVFCPARTNCFKAAWLLVVLGLFLGTVGLFLLPCVAQAQQAYPEPISLHVNDYADVIRVGTRQLIDNAFSDLKEETGIEAVVVTINSIHDYDTGDRTIESFATNLFNEWGVGDSEKNDGVMILVAVKDREVRIEVGSGYGRGQDANMQEVIDEFMLPSFRLGNYSRGIYRGSLAVVGMLTGEWPEGLVAQQTQTSQPRPATTAPRSPSTTSSSGSSSDSSVSPVIYVIAVLFILLRRYLGISSGSGSSDGYDYDDDGGSFGGGSSSSGDSFGGGSSSGGGASGRW